MGKRKYIFLGAILVFCISLGFASSQTVDIGLMITLNQTINQTIIGGSGNGTQGMPPFLFNINDSAINFSQSVLEATTIPWIQLQIAATFDQNLNTTNNHTALWFNGKVRCENITGPKGDFCNNQSITGGSSTVFSANGTYIFNNTNNIWLEEAYLNRTIDVRERDKQALGPFLTNTSGNLGSINLSQAVLEQTAANISGYRTLATFAGVANNTDARIAALERQTSALGPFLSNTSANPSLLNFSQAVMEATVVPWIELRITATFNQAINTTSSPTFSDLTVTNNISAAWTNSKIRCENITGPRGDFCNNQSIPSVPGASWLQTSTGVYFPNSTTSPAKVNLTPSQGNLSIEGVSFFRSRLAVGVSDPTYLERAFVIQSEPAGSPLKIMCDKAAGSFCNVQLFANPSANTPNYSSSWGLGLPGQPDGNRTVFSEYKQVNGVFSWREIWGFTTYNVTIPQNTTIRGGNLTVENGNIRLTSGNITANGSIRTEGNGRCLQMESRPDGARLAAYYC